MSAPDWLHDAVFYQIFPERFANGDPSIDPQGVVPWDSEPTPDNFFGGDLAGITRKLDHLSELGVNALYLTPIFKARTNHRYDAEDYFSIDPALGDEAAFTSLIEAAHGRGIRVVLDAVLNHCGKTHPYFLDAVEREADSEYVDWYYIEDFPVERANTELSDLLGMRIPAEVECPSSRCAAASPLRRRVLDRQGNRRVAPRRPLLHQHELLAPLPSDREGEGR